MRYSTSYVCLSIHLIPPKHIRVIYATKCCNCLKILQILITLPPNQVCVLQASSSLGQMTARCSRQQGYESLPQLPRSARTVRSSPRRDLPNETTGRSLATTPWTVLQTRFRWWRKMNEAPKMLLKVIRTLGWVFRCVGCILDEFQTSENQLLSIWP